MQPEPSWHFLAQKSCRFDILNSAVKAIQPTGRRVCENEESSAKHLINSSLPSPEYLKDYCHRGTKSITWHCRQEIMLFNRAQAAATTRALQHTRGDSTRKYP